MLRARKVARAEAVASMRLLRRRYRPREGHDRKAGRERPNRPPNPSFLDLDEFAGHLIYFEAKVAAKSRRLCIKWLTVNDASSGRDKNAFSDLFASLSCIRFYESRELEGLLERGNAAMSTDIH